MAVKNLRDWGGQAKDPALPFQNGARSKGHLDLASFQFRGVMRGGRERRGKGLPDIHLRQPLQGMKSDSMGKLTFCTIVSVLCLLTMGSVCHCFLPGNGLYLKALPDVQGMAEGLQTVP